MVFKKKYDLKNWLPITKKEVEFRGWKQLDVIIITGDAYIDHPSFGAAVIGRVIENQGYKVAIIPQPNWRDDLRDFKKLGTPRLFFGVTSGSMDSMINHYTANRRLRSTDAYSPGNKSGFRPDYATYVYSNILKKIFPDIPVIIGGIEASLRRFTHYDYWSDSLKPSILAECNADMLVYGMGEKAIIEIVNELNNGADISELTEIPQTAFKKQYEKAYSYFSGIHLHSHEKCMKSKHSFAENFKIIETESNYPTKNILLQKFKKTLVVVNPPYSPYSEKEIDSIYDLPYTRLPHPKYHKKGAIPAYEMIRHSVNIHRGCFGGCSFCTISAHQGKEIVSRSSQSVFKEVELVSKMEDFKGYLSDLGGPSANMYKISGKIPELCKKCKRPSCIYPSVCKNLNNDPTELLNLYKDINKLPYIKKAFIGSGIRYDMFMTEKANEIHQEYFEQVIKHHVSGRLKVAPEHTSENVLKHMRKPSFSLFKRFNEVFESINKKAHMNQQLIPYFISSHPGCRLNDMADLAIESKKMRFHLEQVQDFTPTPMTLATVMYYTGINPYTGKKVYTTTSKHSKNKQKQFFFWYREDMRKQIKNDLIKLGRKDLVTKLFS